MCNFSVAPLLSGPDLSEQAALGIQQQPGSRKIHSPKLPPGAWVSRRDRITSGFEIHAPMPGDCWGQHDANSLLGPGLQRPAAVLRPGTGAPAGQGAMRPVDDDRASPAARAGPGATPLPSPRATSTCPPRLDSRGERRCFRPGAHATPEGLRSSLAGGGAGASLAGALAKPRHTAALLRRPWGATQRRARPRHPPEGRAAGPAPFRCRSRRRGPRASRWSAVVGSAPEQAPPTTLWSHRHLAQSCFPLTHPFAPSLTSAPPHSLLCPPHCLLHSIPYLRFLSGKNDDRE